MNPLDCPVIATTLPWRTMRYDKRRDTDCLNYAASLVRRGGPELREYVETDAWISRFYASVDRGDMSEKHVDTLRSILGPVLSPSTMLGFAWRKPHGYSGDFEIIDRHYLNYIASDPHLANWDHYWHFNPAARAVRNRKAYFHQLLRRLYEARNGSRLSVLNIASGPARDVFEFCSSNGHGITFDCIDNDPKAIAYASQLCQGLTNVKFCHGNALRIRPSRKYDLVWSAGLFDYFSDRIFKLLLRRLLPCVTTGGELVIGNYAITQPHPNLCWLRLTDWHLHHRSAEDLSRLATECGVSSTQVRIGAEPENATLFLHIRRNDSDQA